MECNDCDKMCDNGDVRNQKCACSCKYEFDEKDTNNNNDTKSDREEMYEQLKCYRFAIIELGLYLDTHPNDRKALCLYNDYVRKFKMLENQYQMMFGPLSIMFPCKKWRWLEQPWPWEGGCR